ncbi:MAG: HAD family phosphatase [Chloroflexi bacterium]|nr:MAG: HAD family phosphatase [Chloroflexota bacterium]
MTGESTIRAVVFDLDGLLVDSEPLQLAAWDRYLERFGVALTPDLLDRMLGLRLVDSAKVIVESLDLPVTAEVVMRDRDAIFLASAQGAIRAMPGATALIAGLRERKVRLGLATSGHRRYVDLALESAGLRGAFDIEVTGEHVERGKPAPDAYLVAARLLNLPPGRCLALEDAPNGVLSAVSAGMRCIVVPGHVPDAPEFALADATVSSLDAVLGALIARGWLD